MQGSGVRGGCGVGLSDETEEEYNVSTEDEPKVVLDQELYAVEDADLFAVNVK